MLTKRYLLSVKNVPKIMAKIVEGTAPTRFTIAHLKGLGFTSSNDQSILPMLKELSFLTADGAPTQRYHEYRDQSRSKAVLAEALREAYEEIFHINERPTTSDRKIIEGKFKSTHNVSDTVASKQAMTFFKFMSLADLDAEGADTNKHIEETSSVGSNNDETGEENQIPLGIPSRGGINLSYNVEIHLPATKDVEVFNAIFKSLKNYLLDD